MKSSKKKTIQKVSEWYRTKGFYKRLIDYEFEEMKRYFKGPSLMEIGPADGHHTKDLLKHFDTVVCVEPSKKYAQMLKKIYGNKIEVIQKFVEDIPHKSKYDTIICSHVLEHMPRPVAALKKIKEFMHDGSNLIIIVPNAYSIHRLVAVQMGMLEHVKELNELDKKLGHFRVYDQNDLVSHLKSAGLQPEILSGVFLKVLSNSQLEKWNTPLLDGFYRVGKQLPLMCADILVVCKKQS
jgi:SAM-dependent methyltransferase